MALQIHQLHKLSRERDIKMRLGKLPKTLEEAYHEIYERIQSTEGSASDVAKRAFQWIMCSEEPMSPAMLVAAVCQDPTTDDIDDVDINFDFVLESCQNLLKVEGDEEYAICRFSHLSVQEYLEKDRLSPLSNDVFVAQVCLTILTGPIQSTLSLERAEEDSVESNESEELEEDGMKEVSEYASAYWLIHVQRSGEVEGDFDNRLITLLKRFLGSGAETTPAYEKWYRTRRVGRGRVSSMHSREYLHIHRVKPPSRLALQIAMFGLHRMLQDSWEHVEPGQENAWVDPLLVIAAHGGCVSTVQSLLDKRAEIDASSAKNPSALYEASIRGHESVVKLLLEKGANVNISCGYYGNVLQAASVCGDASIVGLLVASGANVNAQGGEYHNALQAASHQGHEDVVRILLKHGAFDPDGKALSEAASEGHEAVVAMLLQASTIGLNDALVAACKGGTFSIRNPQDKFQGVVTLLLDAGAVDLHGEALIEAAREGNTSVVARLLKEHNVGVDEALVSACGWGTGTWSDIKTHEDAKAIVILLLNAGAVDREGHALQEATRRGFAEVVTLLLDAGAVDLHGEALIEAAREGNTSVVARLLKEHNVGVDEALVSACGWGTGTWSDIKTHEDAKAIVILLLNAGAVDREGHALQEAMENGFAEAATLLRETAEKSKGRISEVVENLSDERIPLKGVLAGSEPQRVAL